MVFCFQVNINKCSVDVLKGHIFVKPGVTHSTIQVRGTSHLPSQGQIIFCHMNVLSLVKFSSPIGHVLAYLILLSELNSPINIFKLYKQCLEMNATYIQTTVKFSVFKHHIVAVTGDAIQFETIPCLVKKWKAVSFSLKIPVLYCLYTCL